MYHHHRQPPEAHQDKDHSSRPHPPRKCKNVRIAAFLRSDQSGSDGKDDNEDTDGEPLLSENHTQEKDKKEEPHAGQDSDRLIAQQIAGKVADSQQGIRRWGDEQRSRSRQAEPCRQEEVDR